DLEEGLHRKRLISYGGLLKEIHKKLNLDDTEEGDLIHTDDDEKADEDGFSIIAMWNWERKNYFIKERSEEHTSELQSRFDLVCRLLLEKKNNKHFLVECFL